MTDQLSALRRIVDEATPGPWGLSPCACGAYFCASHDVGPRDSRGGYAAADARLISIMADPQVAGAFLDVVEAAEEVERNIFTSYIGDSKHIRMGGDPDNKSRLTVAVVRLSALLSEKGVGK